MMFTFHLRRQSLSWEDADVIEAEIRQYDITPEDLSRWRDVVSLWAAIHGATWK